MTAIKYIQAMKVLNKWRIYKDNKRKKSIALQNQILQQQLASPDVQDEDKQEMEGGDVQYMGGEVEVTQVDDPTCYCEQRYKMIQKEEQASQIEQ